MKLLGTLSTGSWTAIAILVPLAILILFFVLRKKIYHPEKF